MAKMRVVSIREETPGEAEMRQWFAQQALASPDTLDAAARLLISLVTGLLTLLFGVLAVAGDPLPSYLAHWPVRVLGVVSVVALLAALGAALGAVLPARLAADPARPARQAAAFAELVRRKAGWLRGAVVAFGLGMAALSLALIVALLAV
jgi:hypothetical protein